MTLIVDPVTQGLAFIGIFALVILAAFVIGKAFTDD